MYIEVFKETPKHERMTWTQSCFRDDRGLIFCLNNLTTGQPTNSQGYYVVGEISEHLKISEWHPCIHPCIHRRTDPCLLFRLCPAGPTGWGLASRHAPSPAPGSRVVPRLLYARQGKLDPAFFVFHIIIRMTLHLPLHPRLICLGRRNQVQKASVITGIHKPPRIRWSGVSQRCVWRMKWTKTAFLKQKINQTRYKRNRDYFKLWMMQSYCNQIL